MGGLKALCFNDNAVNPPQDGNNGTAIVSTTSQPSIERVTLKIGSNLKGEPKWLINKGTPIFKSEAEKIGALRGFVIGNGLSPFMDHPVRYLPEDAAANVAAYRTVMIDGIPAGSTTMDVLRIAKGGSLESVQLFPPIGSATSFMTARVVFVFE